MSPLITRNLTKPVINLRPFGSLPLLRGRNRSFLPPPPPRKLDPIGTRRERLSRRRLSTWRPINPVIITVALLLLALKVCFRPARFRGKRKPILK